MNKYEIMFVVKTDLSEEEKKALFNQISDAIVKNNGTVIEANVWAEKKKLYFPIKRQQEALYYLLQFSIAPEAIAKIRNTYKLNENILRILVSRIK